MPATLQRLRGPALIIRNSPISSFLLIRPRSSAMNTLAGEVAVSLVLICGAMLMLRTLLKLRNVDAGVRTQNVIATSV